MITSIIQFSVKNKLIIALLTVALVVAGVQALRNLPIDAVPDITNNQVQVVTVSPNLAAQEIEQSITYPIEMAMRNLPDVVEVRSISRFGLSLITVVFDDDIETLHARQLVKEQIDIASGELPPGYGHPELMPITTGLGEVYQYVLVVENGYEGRYTATDLRSIHDWIVKRQLAGTKGIIEVSSFGGYLKQYEVAVDPQRLQAFQLSLTEVWNALEQNNENSGSGYIEKGHQAYYIRTEGRVEQLKDIETIVVAQRNGQPILVRDIAQVRFGTAKRFGAMTMDGKGEVVGGITLMLKGANSLETIENVKESVEKLSRSLPEGISIYPYLDRAHLIDKTIHTVEKNLIEGGLIVIFVLVLLLGNLRAGLIAASLIPLSMLFAFMLMDQFGVSANLMSLGAIDFGIIVDGAVIIVEGVLHQLLYTRAGQRLTSQEMDKEVSQTAARIYSSAAYGVLIILIVFVPILTLTGVEGKMFKPMALTVSFALIGAFILSMTYVPMVCALFLNKKIASHHSLPDRIMDTLQRFYRRVLDAVLRIAPLVFGLTLVSFVVAVWLFSRLGQEFIPTLEEGDFAMQMAIQPGSSLSESIATSTKVERILREQFPEIKHVVSKIGTAEVPTDPMAIETADIMIILEDREKWVSANSREELAEKMKTALDALLGASFEVTQPIQLRFNELMTGGKADVAVKIYGDDPAVLRQYADKAADMIRGIDGAGDVKVELTDGLLQQTIRYNKEKMAVYGLNVSELNAIVQAAFAGGTAGVVFEGSARYDLVVRMQQSAELDLSQLFVHTQLGTVVPLSEVAEVIERTGPAQISHENAQRKIDIGVNVRDRDVASLVADIEAALQANLGLPAGYYIRYGGAFENLQAAKARLSIAVPFALLLILVLLYFTFRRVGLALLIFSAVPFAAIGGVIALVLRGMPFSISAGVGFIALFGVAVLNGIVLISSYNQLKESGEMDLKELILRGSSERLRPVLMTALVAALGFIPMAVSMSNGGEVQRPLATVVIGGLVTSTLLTMFVLPILYYWSERRRQLPPPPPAPMPIPTENIVAMIALALIALPGLSQAQSVSLSLPQCEQQLWNNSPLLKTASLEVDYHRTAEKTRWQPGSFLFNYNGGQINYGEFDHQIEAMQSFGNIFSYKQQRGYYQARTRQAEAERWQLHREQRQQLRLAYLDWQFQHEVLSLITDNQNQWKEYLAILDKQHQAGEIDGLKKQLAQLQVQQLEAAIRQQIYTNQQAKQHLLLLARYADGDYVPDALPDSLPALPAQFNDSLLLVYNQQSEALKQEAEWIKKESRSPELWLGAFSQTLNQQVAFSGVKFSISVPIRPQTPIQLQQKQVQQAQLETQIAAQRQNYEWSAAWTAQRQAQIEQNRGYLMQLLEEVRKAQQNALRMVLAGELEYYDYYLLLQQGFELKQQELGLRYESWRNATELRYYAD